MPQIALRWCTSCDDPFCDSCWSLIHLRGKRLRHAFCEIDRKGNVSLNAIGPDGQFAGTFKAGQTGAGYGSDYGKHCPLEKDYILWFWFVIADGDVVGYSLNVPIFLCK